VGSYLNNATITVNGVKYPDTEVPAWSTQDVGLAWESSSANGPLSGLRAAVNVQNIGDKAPPIVLSGTNAVDLANHSIVGRVWSFELTKKF
jgi:iron complex outermembrane receptor protein